MADYTGRYLFKKRGYQFFFILYFIAFVSEYIRNVYVYE